MKPYYFKSILLGFTLLIHSTAFANIVISIRPLAFIAAAIADGVTPVQVLLPDGTSPHTYTLKPSDLAILSNADLVIWIGNNFEPYLNKPLIKTTAHHIAISDLPAVQPLLRTGKKCSCGAAYHDHEAHKKNTKSANDESKNQQQQDATKKAVAHMTYDYHLWLSPAIAKETAKEIGKVLTRLWPKQAEKIAENVQQFNTTLANTEAQIVSMVEPIKNKEYFVFHDAYHYFEARFGLNKVGYFTINPEVQPGVQTLLDIKQKVNEKKAICLFYEPQFSPAIVKKIAEETEVKLGVLDPLGSEISLTKESYSIFLKKLTEQYLACLQ